MKFVQYVNAFVCVIKNTDSYCFEKWITGKPFSECPLEMSVLHRRFHYGVRNTFALSASSVLVLNCCYLAAWNIDGIGQKDWQLHELLLTSLCVVA